jgi:hypothetical protein
MGRLRLRESITAMFRDRLASALDDCLHLSTRQLETFVVVWSSWNARLYQLHSATIENDGSLVLNTDRNKLSPSNVVGVPVTACMLYQRRRGFDKLQGLSSSTRVMPQRQAAAQSNRLTRGKLGVPIKHAGRVNCNMLTWRGDMLTGAT